jgi:hypothetical protein
MPISDHRNAVPAWPRLAKFLPNPLATLLLIEGRSALRRGHVLRARLVNSRVNKIDDCLFGRTIVPCRKRIDLRESLRAGVESDTGRKRENQENTDMQFHGSLVKEVRSSAEFRDFGVALEHR